MRGDLVGMNGGPMYMPKLRRLENREENES